MDSSSFKVLTEEEKSRLISLLTPHLLSLRAQANVSQEELAVFIGVSRQTYGAIERKSRAMSWNTYLSLIFFYDYNQSTHQLLRSLDAFPYEIINYFNDDLGLKKLEISTLLGADLHSLINSFDEQAIHSIRTHIMLEYARCTGIPGEAVVKSFDGRTFDVPLSRNEKITEAIKTLKEYQRAAD